MTIPSPPPGGGKPHAPTKPPTVSPSGSPGLDAALKTTDFARVTTVNEYKLKIGVLMMTDNAFNLPRS